MLRHFAAHSLNLLKKKEFVNTSVESTIVCLLRATADNLNCYFLDGVHLYSCASFSPHC